MKWLLCAWLELLLLLPDCIALHVPLEQTRRRDPSILQQPVTGTAPGNAACSLGGRGWGPRQPGVLRILIQGTACGGVGCEARSGSERIEGTNLGNGLRMLGHEVHFRDCGMVDGSDVVIARPGTPLEELRRDDPGRVIVAMKTDSKSQWDWVRQVDLYMANSGLHSLFHSAGAGLRPERAVVLRLVEVPSGFWGAQLQDPHADMYRGIPQHTPRPFKVFSSTRPVQLCYHGNRYHLALESGLLAALRRLPQELGLPVRLSLIQDLDPGLELALRVNSTPPLSLAQSPWLSTDTTYAQLATCDLGLVPNLEEAPNFSTNAAVHNPQLNLKFKSSTNAGRAYVMAQVGLPFVSSPEPETAELLGSAGLRAQEFMAFGTEAWVAVLAQLLHQDGRRANASRALRDYAEKGLRPEKEAAELERRIWEVRNGLGDWSKRKAV